MKMMRMHSKKILTKFGHWERQISGSKQAGRVLSGRLLELCSFVWFHGWSITDTKSQVQTAQPKSHPLRLALGFV